MPSIAEGATEGLNIAQKFFVVAFIGIILLSLSYTVAATMNNNTDMYQVLVGPFLKYWPLAALLISLGVGLIVLVPVIKKLMTEMTV